MNSDSVASETSTLKIGDMAPDFTLPVANKDMVGGQASFTLSEYRGKKNVVVVFYPFAWTPV